jgi:hypothetical protein
MKKLFGKIGAVKSANSRSHELGLERISIVTHTQDFAE